MRAHIKNKRGLTDMSTMGSQLKTMLRSWSTACLPLRADWQQIGYLAAPLSGFSAGIFTKINTSTRYIDQGQEASSGKERHCTKPKNFKINLFNAYKRTLT